MAVSTRFRGLSFPFRKGPSGFPQAAMDDDLIRDSLKQIVLTQKGERVFRPTLGCSAMSLVFENNSVARNALLVRSIAKAITENEPRVDLNDVVVESEDSKVTATIYYSVNGQRAQPLAIDM